MTPRRRWSIRAGPCLLALGLGGIVVASHLLSAATPPTLAARAVPAAQLGIGELEMGPDFGRPVAAPRRSPLATVGLSLVLLLCPAKFVFLWILQRRETRDMRLGAGAAARSGP